MSDKNIIPICAITDERLSFTVSALFISILENSTKNNFFKFYCFVNDKVSKTERDKILSTQDKYTNCSIEIIDMGNSYQDCINRHSTVTNACLYKFAIIDKLTQYDKVIYLDTDIVVNGDIAELYNIDLKDNYVGGVFNIFYYIYKKNLSAMLKIPDLESYFNAGVMLMNLKKMREDNIVQNLEKYIGQFEGSVDQHIFNKVCYGKILNIHPKYNLTLKYQELYQLPEAETFYTKQEIREAIENPVIMHYTGDRKPWIFANLQLSWKWYKYFRQSAFKDYPLNRQAFNINNAKPPFIIKMQNKMLAIGAAISNVLNLKVDYYQFFSVVRLVKQRKISPICIIINSTQNCLENENILKLVTELKKKGKVVFVISKSGGNQNERFKQAAHYFFKLSDIDFRVIKTLRAFQFVIISEADMYKDAETMMLNNLSYLWLIQNSGKKDKIIKKYPVASELVNGSNNIIEGFDLNKLLNMLNK